MKKTVLSLLFLLISHIDFAQSYKILNSASGTLESFESLVDGDELFGYVELRKLDLEDKLTEKYKYILLDKNMNTINTGEFSLDLLKKKCMNNNYQVVYNKGHVIFCFEELFYDRGYLPIRGSYQILNVEQNKMVSSGYFGSNPTKKVSIPALNMLYKKSYIGSLSDSGFLVQTTSIDPEVGLKEYYYGMDFMGKQTWQQTYKKAEAKHDYETTFFDKDKNNIVLLLTKNRNSKKVSDHMQILDTKTGKEVAFVDLSNDKYTLRFSNVELKEGKLYILGRFFEKEKRDRVEADESLGLYRRIIDIKTGKILNEDFLAYDKFKNPNINENGRIKKEGYLSFQKININPDGSYFIIAETYIEKSRGANVFNELYTFTLDKDFKPLEMKGFDAARTRGSKYSFSQELPNNVGKAYFFYDKNEEKEFELNIMKYMYASKKISVDKMNLNNEKSNIRVSKAKPGYVGITERFKNPKKDEKTLEIRLEKLNYERE